MRKEYSLRIEVFFQNTIENIELSPNSSLSDLIDKLTTACKLPKYWLNLYKITYNLGIEILIDEDFDQFLLSSASKIKIEERTEDVLESLSYLQTAAAEKKKPQKQQKVVDEKIYTNAGFSLMDNEPECDIDNKEIVINIMPQNDQHSLHDVQHIQHVQYLISSETGFSIEVNQNNLLNDIMVRLTDFYSYQRNFNMALENRLDNNNQSQIINSIPHLNANNPMKPASYIHQKKCFKCKATIIGIRFKCLFCAPYNLCESCLLKNDTKHFHQHTTFIRITNPVEYNSEIKQSKMETHQLIEQKQSNVSLLPNKLSQKVNDFFVIENNQNNITNENLKNELSSSSLSLNLSMAQLDNSKSKISYNEKITAEDNKTINIQLDHHSEEVLLSIKKESSIIPEDKDITIENNVLRVTLSNILSKTNNSRAFIFRLEGKFHKTDWITIFFEKQ